VCLKNHLYLKVDSIPRLVILGMGYLLTENLRCSTETDYLMRNTDRGSDNYMIKACEATHEKSLVDVAPSAAQQPHMSSIDGRSQLHVPFADDASSFHTVPADSSSVGQSYLKRPHMHIAAIDNSLSFPHEHPKGWRSYTYGRSSSFCSELHLKRSIQAGFTCLSA
jgi:hypothetical protein